jgi:hypothetical protein
MDFVFNDGGRLKVGYKGKTGDCVVRAISIATEQSYDVVYDDLNNLISLHRNSKQKKKSHSRTGIFKKFADKYLTSLGWKWVACMTIGSGCKVHLKASELPNGRIICRVSKHLTCVIDGVLYDTWDCSKNETKCVYGYWVKK